MNADRFQSMKLPRQEVEAIVATVSALDREPISWDVLLKAVRFVAERLGDEIQETDERAERGLLRFRSRRWNFSTSVSIEDGHHYHCWGYCIIQGDTSEWVAATTSELVWKIFGPPSLFVALPRGGKKAN
jgi:hypothetical protein